MQRRVGHVEKEVALLNENLRENNYFLLQTLLAILHVTHFCLKVDGSRFSFFIALVQVEILMQKLKKKKTDTQLITISLLLKFIPVDLYPLIPTNYNLAEFELKIQIGYHKKKKLRDKNTDLI